MFLIKYSVIIAYIINIIALNIIVETGKLFNVINLKICEIIKRIQNIKIYMHMCGIPFCFFMIQIQIKIAIQYITIAIIIEIILKVVDIESGFMMILYTI